MRVAPLALSGMRNNSEIAEHFVLSGEVRLLTHRLKSTGQGGQVWWYIAKLTAFKLHWRQKYTILNTWEILCDSFFDYSGSNYDKIPKMLTGSKTIKVCKPKSKRIVFYKAIHPISRLCPEKYWNFESKLTQIFNQIFIKSNTAISA